MEKPPNNKVGLLQQMKKALEKSLEKEENFRNALLLFQALTTSGKEETNEYIKKYEDFLERYEKGELNKEETIKNLKETGKNILNSMEEKIS